MGAYSPYRGTRFSPARIAFFLPAAAWYAVVFLLSGQTGDESTQLSDAVVQQSVGLMGRLGEIFRVDWEALMFLTFLVRKAAHMAAYFLLAALILFALWKLPLRPTLQGWVTLAACAVLAGLDEFHQYFVPGRDGRLRDVLIDLGGTVIFLLLWLLVRALLRRRQRRRQRA